ncbi:Myb-like DNA-binding domain [Popillia japonica]|uniref:Myb-like DNA-binding domain n=1 Tax=Popillia japonica TaxID=7064 RepID=A0AAW1JXJ5_POPJA
MSSSREHVESFYSFWYEFKSWREYSYEDEEDKEKCQDRDERRYVDKMNKAERLRKKKEEMSRIRQLVDLAYNADPRIAKFKQEDKERKLAMKKAKQTAAQQRKEEEEKALRELQEAKDKAEAEERAKLEAKRLEREAQKKILKKERKTFRDTCKANNYFTQDKDEMLKHMQAIESICETLSAIELEELNKNLKNNGRQAFTKALNESESRIEEEKKSVLESYTQRVTNQLETNNPALRIAEWTNDNLHLLIKAVNLFPAGTNQRWEVVANFINQHGSFPENSKKFNAKAVLAKAKDLQNTDFSKNNLKEAANKQAFDNLKKDKRNVVLVDETGISKKIDEEKPIKVKKSKQEITETVNGSQNLANGDIKMEKPWTATEQQLLEQALKTYPASTAERWDRIADCVPERSKKDCMKRYKELVEIVKAKKAAQLAATSK